MKLFKKRITRKRIKKLLKNINQEYKEHLATFNPKKPPKLNSQKRKFVQKRYDLEIKIEFLKEILG